MEVMYNHAHNLSNHAWAQECYRVNQNEVSQVLSNRYGLV